MFQSHNRNRITAVAVALAIFGPVAVSTPVSAADSRPDLVVAASHKPPGVVCPLTDAQLAYGKAVVEGAIQTVERATRAGGVLASDPIPTVSADPSVWGDASSCFAAIQDIGTKNEAVEDAVNSLLGCLWTALWTGESCGAEDSHLDAVLHELDVALSNLKQTCPWIAFF